MQIKAALLFAPGEKLKIETITLDAPKAGEVRIKLAASGVCHSDYHVMTGDTKQPNPVILGDMRARASWRRLATA
jgi:S-(hydroxymethyl)glutathione dehydrogenase / alcohol dehydrogenase